MKVSIVTWRRSTRLIQLDTVRQQGRRFLQIRAYWQDHDGHLHPASGSILVPKVRIDELIARMIELNDAMNLGQEGDDE